MGWAQNIDETLSNNSGLVKSRANSIRLAVNRERDNFGICAPAQKREAVRKLLGKRLVAIIETHFYYENANEMALFRRSTDSLKTIVDDWLNPDNISWLRDYEKQVILNITNEWGVDFGTWKTANIAAVKRLRNAGIKCPIMIDAGGDFAQNPNSLISGAQEILNSDPQKNILFSLHMYGYWVTVDSSTDYRNQINNWGSPVDTPCISPNCAAWDLLP